MMEKRGHHPVGNASRVARRRSGGVRAATGARSVAPLLNRFTLHGYLPGVRHEPPPKRKPRVWIDDAQARAFPVGPQGPIGTDDRKRVPDPGDPPWRHICALRITTR